MGTLLRVGTLSQGVRNVSLTKSDEGYYYIGDEYRECRVNSRDPPVTVSIIPRPVMNVCCLQYQNFLNTSNKHFTDAMNVPSSYHLHFVHTAITVFMW